MKTVTVFTPTYNRADLLVNLYNSLVKQTSMDFCWIIVDDGSKDNTKEVVNNWIKEGIIDIKYYYQENAGKMKAHNNGVKHTETELFLCVDSDDYLTSDAVEQIINTWNNYRNNNMAGIIAYKKLLNCPEMNSVFPEKIEISSLSDLYNNGFVGETALVFNTSVIKQYLFPEIDGEKFITEAYVYEQIDKTYKYALLRYTCMLCEYREDGYTNNALRLRRDNPKGWALYYAQRSACNRKYREKWRDLAYANCFRILGKEKILFGDKKLIGCLSIVPAIYLLVRYKREFKKIL